MGEWSVLRVRQLVAVAVSMVLSYGQPCHERGHKLRGFGIAQVVASRPKNPATESPEGKFTGACGLRVFRALCRRHVGARSAVYVLWGDFHHEWANYTDLVRSRGKLCDLVARLPPALLEELEQQFEEQQLSYNAERKGHEDPGVVFFPHRLRLYPGVGAGSGLYAVWSQHQDALGQLSVPLAPSNPGHCVHGHDPNQARREKTRLEPADRVQDLLPKEPVRGPVRGCFQNGCHRQSISLGAQKVSSTSGEP